MRLLSYSAILLLGSGAVVAAPTASQSPAAGQTTIETAAFSGSGCPPGSAGTALSADGTMVTLIFDDFVASSGPGIAITERLKACDLQLGVHYPLGWQWALFTANFHGFASLQAGSLGLGGTSYYFSRDNELAETAMTLSGPISSDYVMSSSFDVESYVWSPCGSNATLNINSFIRIVPAANDTGSDQLTVDSDDFKFNQTYGIQWRKC